MGEENQENKEVIEVQGEVKQENSEAINETQPESNAQEQTNKAEENNQEQSESKQGNTAEIITQPSEETNGQENIQISNDVIAVIAGVAVSEVAGVASMAGGFAGGISEVLSGKKNMAKGIKVDKTEDKIKIDVNIVVEYGTRIPDIAFDIQNRVKKAVENMTGMKVEEVNVHVQGVDTNVKKNETTSTEKNQEENNNQE
ncbi:MAG: Asp23/Gls24 family envelope stress response protein [Clostridia bacterium]|nr:Asp23/Gls24 family envelope stress response protein [Clostridia bacterium]